MDFFLFLPFFKNLYACLRLLLLLTQPQRKLELHAFSLPDYWNLA